MPLSSLLLYIGPGAGFALLGSFLVIFLLVLLAPLSVAYSFLRFLVLSLRGKRAYGRAVVDRVVVVGLDGLDPEITEQMMARGELPHLRRLQEEGDYRRLATTFPAVSPVAWSSFQTGSNPGRHNIFDFLGRDRRTYLPTLSSARIGKPRRTLPLGRYRLPLGRPEVRLLRRSKPFWAVLGEAGIFSTVLRVPISFPAEPFYGLSLAAMSVPDLKGSQGTFALLSTGNGDAIGDASASEEGTGGVRLPVERQGSEVAGLLPGPDNPLTREGEELQIPFRGRVDEEAGRLELRIAGHGRLELRLGEYSDWVALRYRAGLGVKIRGICRFRLLALSPQVRLYLTPIQIDPERPALPISYPSYYASYLAGLQGRFSTLGLAEDTWALNEGVLDEDAFLEQTELVEREREEMFFSALDRTRRGLLVCVFDGPDRIQHMFWRGREPDHPANGARGPSRVPDAVEQMYRRMDALVGRVRERLGEEDRTALIVMSDHGFKSFRRGINLNAWLRREGLLALSGEQAGEWFDGVDWSRTRAFALGLGGIYLNLAGREAEGIVTPGEEAEAVTKQIREGLEGLVDEATGERPVARVYRREEIYRGPYVEEAPDLLVGCHPGTRVSWQGATGVAGGPVFEDNVKAWSGDHCVDPPQVPGVLFTNRRLEAKEAGIVDIGPTVLELFGVPVPDWMDGRPLVQREEERSGA